MVAFILSPHVLSALLQAGALLQIVIPLAVIVARAGISPAFAPDRELVRRVLRVLRLTIGGSALAFVLLLLVSAPGFDADRFGLVLVAFEVGQVALMVRRWLGPRTACAARLDTEILYLLFATGLLALTHADAVRSTDLGRGFALVLCPMFLSRSLLQVFYFRPVWPAGGASRAGGAGLALGFLAISFAYGLNASAPYLSPLSKGDAVHGAH